MRGQPPNPVWITCIRDYKKYVNVLQCISESNMTIEIDLPEDIAKVLESRWGDISRYALELLAVEAYRSGTLSAEQLHRMLSLRTQRDVEAFLKTRLATD